MGKYLFFLTSIWGLTLHAHPSSLIVKEIPLKQCFVDSRYNPRLAYSQFDNSSRGWKAAYAHAYTVKETVQVFVQDGFGEKVIDKIEERELPVVLMIDSNATWFDEGRAYDDVRRKARIWICARRTSQQCPGAVDPDPCKPVDPNSK